MKGRVSGFRGFQRAFGRCEKAAVSGEVHLWAVSLNNQNKVGLIRYAGYSITSAKYDALQNGSGTAVLRLPKNPRFVY